MPLNVKGNTGQFLQTYGQLQVDKYGLSTATAVYHDSGTGAPSLPSIDSSHPVWSELKAERITVDHYQTHWEIVVGYAGVFGTPTPVYELDLSTAEEPIESHPEFATFGGTPAVPENGAVFDSEGAFVTFKPLTGVAPGEVFAGVRSYLAPGAVWRENSIQSSSPDSGLSTVGLIDTPAGSPPSTSGLQNWLYTGMSFEKRGGAYTVRKEWRLSGLGGWNVILYSP